MSDGRARVRYYYDFNRAVSYDVHPGTGETKLDYRGRIMWFKSALEAVNMCRALDTLEGKR